MGAKEQEEVEQEAGGVDLSDLTTAMVSPGKNYIGNMPSRHTLRHRLDNFQAGIIAKFAKQWAELMLDAWIAPVVHVVYGYFIKLEDLPYQGRTPHPLRLREEEQIAPDVALAKFLEQGIIERCKCPSEDSFYSTLHQIQERRIS